jgi:hypothetical protein
VGNFHFIQSDRFKFHRNRGDEGREENIISHFREQNLCERILVYREDPNIPYTLMSNSGV